MKKMVRSFPEGKIYIRNVVWAILLFLICSFFSCRKEGPLQPTDRDINHLVVEDNPADPTDHAIYQFYQSTKIPLFYNDTVNRRQVGDSAGIPIYFYNRLALAYSPLGLDTRLGFTLLRSKQQVLPMLDLLRDGLVARLPEGLFIPSILVVDSLKMVYRLSYFVDSVDAIAYHGFDAIAIKSVLPDTMSADQKNRYVASILAIITAKRFMTSERDKLDANFFSISKNTLSALAVYDQLFTQLSPDGTRLPEDFGFIYYYVVEGVTYTTIEEEDLRAYLESVFYFTTASFNAQYAGYPVVLEKFSIAKAMAKDLGFQFPD